jgi:hypothetical protein
MSQDVLLLSKCFPGATSWGVLGSVAMSRDRWQCANCGHHSRLLVWKGQKQLFCDCIACFWKSHEFHPEKSREWSNLPL